MYYLKVVVTKDVCYVVISFRNPEMVYKIVFLQIMQIHKKYLRTLTPLIEHFRVTLSEAENVTFMKTTLTTLSIGKDHTQKFMIFL